MGSAEHPARNRVPDPDFGADTYPHATRYIDPTDSPDYDPDPIPNIVLHPGDTLVLESVADNGERLTVRLIDRYLKHYATLDCGLYDRGWRIHAIRFVSGYGGASEAEQTPASS